MMTVLTHRDFEPYLGVPFRIAGWPHMLRLAAVDVRHGQSRPDNSGPPFTLIFHGPRGALLPEGSHSATPEQSSGAAPTAAMVFHIMPIHTTAADRQEYQAIFN